jgi:hypothetical protein
MNNEEKNRLIIKGLFFGVLFALEWFLFVFHASISSMVLTAVMILAANYLAMSAFK